MTKFFPSDLIDLRILATTDIHMNLSGFDYFKDRQGPGNGLAGLAQMIEASRATGPNCLLFDNGDMLQGAALGDYIAQVRGISRDRPHPAILTMNQLRYDAMTLGNHDFSFGCDFLTTSLARADFPITATNLRMPDAPAIQNHLLLIREVTDRRGQRHILRIGVLGFLPPQTTDWDKSLRDSVRIDDILTAAKSALPALHAQKPDLVIALAHSGIGAANPPPRSENAATALAAIKGIDIVIAGHIHRAFPSSGFPVSAGVDPLRGTLHGKPAVMAGFGGSHLGVIDLTLQRQGNGWRIGTFTSRAVPAQAGAPPCPSRQQIHQQIHRLLAPDHQATRRHFARPVAESSVPLHSDFALLGHDAGLQLVNQAQAWHIEKQMESSALSHLPVLSTTAPCRAGGRGGPTYYTNIAQGPLLLRHLADLYPFPNLVAALLVSGADLHDWLERAAGAFQHLAPGTHAQNLIDPQFPSYHFDVISDLEWQIDLTRPARYDAAGRRSATGSQRLRDLRYKGQPVLPKQHFILATNSYRLSDCGPFAPLVRGARVVHESALRSRDILRHYLEDRRRIAPPAALGFRFIAPHGTRALFDTAPSAATRLEAISHFSPAPLAPTAEGFLQLQLHL